MFLKEKEIRDEQYVRNYENQQKFIKKTEDAYTEPGLTDPELGLRYCFSFLLPYKKNRSSKIRTKLPAFLLNTEKCNKSILT